MRSAALRVYLTLLVWTPAAGTLFIRRRKNTVAAKKPRNPRISERISMFVCAARFYWRPWARARRSSGSISPSRYLPMK